MHYIKGGRYDVTGKVHSGCRDKSLPVKECRYSISNQLYFAERSKLWENKAVAFIDANSKRGVHTLCYLYLVTEEQFYDIFLQENGKTPDDADNYSLNLSALRPSVNSLLVGNENELKWYGRVMFLGEHDGHSIYTFTNKDARYNKKIAMPGNKYIKVIMEGIMETHKLSLSDTVAYMIAKPGIENNMCIEDLYSIYDKE